MSKRNTKLVQWLELVLLTVTAGVGIVIAVLDVSGLLDSGSWVIKRIPVITLLSVGFIASYLIIERRNKIDKIATFLQESHKEIVETISASSSQAIQALEGVEIQSYNSREEFARAFVHRIKRAKHIDDLVWSNYSGKEPTSEKGATMTQTYSVTVDQVLRKPDVVWREIVIFTASRFARTEERIMDQRIKGFNVGFFDEVEPSNAPRPSFMLVDNEDLFLFHLPNQLNLRLRIKHPTLVSYFAKYYEALWEKSIKLKQGEKIDYSQLNNLRTIWVEALKDQSEVSE
jgi:hypothetical protein